MEAVARMLREACVQQRAWLQKSGASSGMVGAADGALQLPALLLLAHLLHLG